MTTPQELGKNRVKKICKADFLQTKKMRNKK